MEQHYKNSIFVPEMDGTVTIALHLIHLKLLST